jgi:hypothetical protein
MERKQHSNPGRSRKNRDRDAKARIIPKADLDVLTRRFHHDHVSDRTDDGKVAGKRRGQRQHFLHQCRLSESRDPVCGHQDKGNVGENVRTDDRKPRQIPGLSPDA